MHSLLSANLQVIFYHLRIPDYRGELLAVAQLHDIIGKDEGSIQKVGAHTFRYTLTMIMASMHADKGHFIYNFVKSGGHVKIFPSW